MNTAIDQSAKSFGFPRLRKSALAGAIAAAFCAPLAVLADPTPLTPEFEVAAQGVYPAIARDASGDIVMTWLTYGGGTSLYVGLYDSSGTARGAPILVTSTATEAISAPQVAMDGAGNFVVTWTAGTSPSSEKGNTTGTVYAQLYAADGTANGSVIDVGTVWINNGYNNNTAVAMDPAGDFDVTWANNKLLYEVQGDPTEASSKVYTRLFAADGTPKTAAIVVDTLLGHLVKQECADVAMDASGNFTVAWTTYKLPKPLKSEISSTVWVRAQRFNSSGTPQGAHLAVDTYANSTYPDAGGCANIAMDPAGDFGISWHLLEPTVTASIYAANGTLDAGPLDVATNASQPTPPIAFKGTMDAAGDFLVPWGVSPSPGSNAPIPSYGQFYSLDGTPKGGIFPIATDGQYFLGTAVDSLGNLAADWTTPGGVVEAQLFSAP